MERTSEYKTNTVYTPKGHRFCSCGEYLGDTHTIHWYHNRRGWVESDVFVRMVDETPVARLFVRGEIVCSCGKKVVWNA